MKERMFLVPTLHLLSNTEEKVETFFCASDLFFCSLVLCPLVVYIRSIDYR